MAARRSGRQAPAGDAPAAAPTRLRIVGPPGGRWRAGRRWGPEAVELDAAALPPETLAALHADPALIVAVVAEGEADRPPAGG